MTTSTTPPPGAAMNDKIRRAIRRGNASPSPESVLADLKTVAKTLDPDALTEFVDKLLEIIREIVPDALEETE